MRKTLPILLCLCLLAMGQLVYSQHSRSPVIPAKLKDLCIKKITPSLPLEAMNPLKGPRVLPKSGPLSPNETIIGVTRWDAQSYSSLENRIFLYPDGTIGATFIYGTADPSFPERGTGYNYFDGTSWGPQPTVRIEDQRVGFGAYAPYGEAGEINVAHNGANGTKICIRDTKGTGNWTYKLLSGPTGHEETLWPYVMTGGTNRHDIHLLTWTASSVYSGTSYLGQDGAIVYSRSSDGGNTWNPQNEVIPGTGYQDYTKIDPETYPVALPKGNNIAFVVGDNFYDLFLMKSSDNGTSWTKTVIFQHPYPHFVETTTLVLDTPWVSDGSQAVALDNNGMAHVFFGVMRVLNDDTTDGNYSYFPYTDGLGYWNESMPPITSMNFDSLWNHNNLVGWTQDFNGNDTMDMIGIGTYQLSLTSMPSVTIDDDNNMFLLFTSVREDRDNGSQNYRHVFGRMSSNSGQTWTDMQDVTGGITHNFHECVFPFNSPTSNDNIHFLYQQDEEPGGAVFGDSDPYGDNNIVYVKVPKSDFCGVSAGFTVDHQTVNIATPPATVQFTDASTGTVTSWAWDFGDGGTSTVQNPSHTYTAVGDYTAKLTVSDGTCSDNFTMVIHVINDIGFAENSLLSFVSQNVPNPFTGSSVINVSLARSSDLSLEIYDLVGKKISVQEKGKVGTGNYSFTLDAGLLGKGVYFYTVKADNQSVTRKMTVN